LRAAIESSPASANAANRVGSDEPSLRVTQRERVASVILALVILVGFAVLILVARLLGARAAYTPPSQPVEMIEDFAGAAEPVSGSAQSLEPPGMEQMPDVQQPQLADTLAAVTDAASSLEGQLEQLAGKREQAGRGSGAGDSRQAGPPGEGRDDVVPIAQRWRIAWAADSQAAYAARLDSLGIELGVLGGGSPIIDYAAKLSAAAPQRRAGPRSQEKRRYFGYLRGKFATWDRQLAEKAGIPVKGRVVVEFFPDLRMQELAALERKAMGSRDLSEVLLTQFGVRQVGDKYEFYVTDQQYR